MDRESLKSTLRRDEGVKAKPYKDSLGHLTIGVGRLLEKGLSPAAIDFLLEEDLDDVEAFLDAKLPWWRDLSEVRQEVLANMAFNLGGKLLTFKTTLARIKAGNYEGAAGSMLASLWAKQVGQRATRLAKQMIDG